MVLVFTNSMINPLIYAANYRDFQQGVRSLIHRIRRQHHIQPQDDLALGEMDQQPRDEHQRSDVPEA